MFHIFNQNKVIPHNFIQNINKITKMIENYDELLKIMKNILDHLSYLLV